jgi:hypothetical protein
MFDSNSNFNSLLCKTVSKHYFLRGFEPVFDEMTKTNAERQKLDCVSLSKNKAKCFI